MLTRLLPGRKTQSASGRRTLRADSGSYTLVGRPGDRYFERARSDGHSERLMRYVLECGVRSDGAALDVGANIGLTSLIIASHRTGPVYAFEPHPETFGYLEETIAANGADTVTPLNLGLGRAAGKIPFYADEDSSASHVVSPHIQGRTPNATVAISTIDAFASSLDMPVDFIKIDAEGSEPDILAGAADVIARDRPAAYVEFNIFTLVAFSDSSPREMLHALRRTFTYVYRFAGSDPYPIESDAQVVDYLHECLTHRRIATDLFCTFDPL